MKYPILKKGATKEQIQRHLLRVDLKKCQNEDGKWISPITGEEFDSFFKLSGHIGAKLRTINETPLTDDRAGYVKARRRGIPPTDAQVRAHREYMRAYRREQREAAELEDSLLS